MATPKAAWGAKASFNLGAYAPNVEELRQFIEEIESIVGKKTTKRFQNIFWQLIAMLRYDADSKHNEELPNLDNSLVEVQHIKKALEKNLQLFSYDKGMNSITSKLYTYQLIKHNLTDEKNPIAAIFVHSQQLLRITNEIEQGIKNTKQSNKNLPSEMRQIAAEELARAFHQELEIKPTKYRGGKFEQCFRFLLQSAKFQIENRKLVCSIPADLLPVISEAIDSYPDKSSILLSEGEIHAGLTGDFST